MYDMLGTVQIFYQQNWNETKRNKRKTSTEYIIGSWLEEKFGGSINRQGVAHASIPTVIVAMRYSKTTRAFVFNVVRYRWGNQIEAVFRPSRNMLSVDFRLILCRNNEKLNRKWISVNSDGAVNEKAKGYHCGRKNEE